MPEAMESYSNLNNSVTLIQEEMRKISEALLRKPETLLKRKPRVR